jgi:hypothetical protein
MPHPNVETLRRIDQAQVAGDLETALSQYTDDVLGHVGGDNQLSGDYRGLDQLQAMLGPVHGGERRVRLREPRLPC